MKAVLALLGAIALANAYTVSTPYWQAYYIYYDDTACSIASVASIELYSSYSSAYTGTGLNGVCYSGQACATWGTGSYEIVCVNGSPENLGVMATRFYGVCDTGSTRPFYDYYATPSSSTIGNDREIYDLKTWMPGCHQSSDFSSYYDTATVNTGALGCTVNYYGDCSDISCNASTCGLGSTYSLASTASGCVTQTTDVYLDCSATAYVAPASKDLLFSIDFTQDVWNLGDCGTGCPTYYLGDGYCDSGCQNNACDNDCNLITGICDCCIPATQSSCCTPDAYSAYDFFGNTCCTADVADQELNTNNTYYIKIFEACLCDGINSNLGLSTEVSTNADGVCDVSPIASSIVPSGNGTLTSTTVVCDAAKVISWCYAHAMQDSHYTTAAGTGTATTEWITAQTQTTTTTNGGVPVPTCLGVGGSFVADYTTAGGNFPAGSANDMCDFLSALAGTGCDAVCGSASTLALSALFALVF